MECKPKSARGITLVEVLVVASVVVIFFGGLLSGVTYTMKIIGSSKARVTALSVASDQVEYIRSLTYNAVGTVAGIPPGAIPQTSTTTVNNIDFTVRTLIAYVDDDADGIGGSDSNAITTDYKQAKVTVSWERAGVADEISLVTNIIPRSIETNVGGGTLRVNVFDADVQPLPGVDVRLVNATMTPPIDVTRTTDSTGVVLFGGAPAGSEYEIFVSEPGYSSDQTYRATTSLPFPSVLPVSVVEADISTVNFFVDRVSEIEITAYDAYEATSTTLVWDDVSDFATSSAVTVVGSDLVLEQAAGLYAATGTAFFAVEPVTVDRWETLVRTAAVSPDVTVHLRFYTGSSTLTLISEADMPGNAAGFTASNIDISMLNAVTYPSLVVGIHLATASSTVTPSVSNITVDYISNESTVANVPLSLTGTKTIGTDTSGAVVYKNIYTGLTNTTGRFDVSDVEWDSYRVSASGYDISEACPANPLTVAPNTTQPLSLILTTNTAHSLRVVTQTTAGVPVAGAEVTLSRPGYNETQITGVCGQVYFGGVTSANDYTITADTPSYTTHTTTDYGISGDSVYVVQW